MIERADIKSGLRGTAVRIEKRRDGSLSVRFQQHYLRHRSCDPDAAREPASRLPSKPAKKPAQKSGWMDKFELRKSPSLGKAIAISNAKN